MAKSSSSPEQQEATPPTGQTSQRYDGETDVAHVIKLRNQQREYEQQGMAWPPVVPTVEGLEPSSAVIGGEDVVMTVTGTGFTQTAKIIFNGGEETTSVISGTECSTIVKPSLAGAAVDVPVLVRTDAGDSNAVTFSFTEPVLRATKAKEDEPKHGKAKADDDEKADEDEKAKGKAKADEDTKYRYKPKR